MSSSPSADLYYGYDLADLQDPETYDDLRPGWMEDDDDAETRLATVLGWAEVSYVDNSDPVGHKAWSDNLSEKWALTRAYPVEMVGYGYMEDPAFAVRVKASVQCVGDYGSIPVQLLAVDPTWDGQLADYMRLMELPIPVGVTPGWHMNCSYG